MTRPSIVVAPYPRGIDETFDAATWAELNEIADVVWGRDEPIPAEVLTEAIASASAVAFGQWPEDPAALEAAGPDLRALFEMLGTHDHPNLDYIRCFEHGIRVGSAAPAFGPVVAEMCLALALAAARGVAVSDRGFRSRSEAYLHAGDEGNTTLFGRTVGFIGCGSISRALQALIEPFGVTLVGYDPWLEKAVLAARGIEQVELDELFRRSHVVFVLAVPTPANKGMIGDGLMRILDPEDVLVLGSRAHVVDFEALTEHLQAGHFKAGIDVFPREPLPPDHPIRDAEPVVLTAHLAGALPEALQDIGRMVLADFRALLAGKEPERMQYADERLVRSLRATSG
jgi:phosphoglycerate dehydrogenase-like enzyme